MSPRKPGGFSKLPSKSKARQTRRNLGGVSSSISTTLVVPAQSNNNSIMEVLPLVSKYLNRNTILSVRCVSRTWKHFSDKLLAHLCASGTTSFSYNLDSSSKIQAFITEFKNRPLNWNVLLGRRVKLFPGDLDLDEIPSGEHYWKNVTTFLQTFGIDVWYITIGTFEYDESQKLLSILRECLPLLPNLRELEVEHLISCIQPTPHNNYFWYGRYDDDIKKFVSYRNIVDSIKLYGVPFTVGYPLMHYAQPWLKRLSLHSSDLTMTDKLDFPLLEELDVRMLRGEKSILELEFGAKNSRLKTVRLAFEEDSVDVHELVNFLNQFKASLEHLTLRVGADHIKNLEMLSKLDLPKVQRVEFNWSNVASFDFLLVLEKSLQHIKLENCISQDEGVLQLRCGNAGDTLYESKIWKELPRLETVSIRNNVGSDFNKKCYSRAMYDFLKRSNKDKEHNN